MQKISSKKNIWTVLGFAKSGNYEFSESDDELTSRAAFVQVKMLQFRRKYLKAYKVSFN